MYVILMWTQKKKKVKQLNVYVKTGKDSHVLIKNKLVVTKGEKQGGRDK